jgi:hypothetical protein
LVTTNFRAFTIIKVHNTERMTVNTRPNPFTSNIIVETVSEQPAHAIVRLYDHYGRFIRIISWDMAKGRNITMFRDLEELEDGTYVLDAVDSTGNTLYKVDLVKRVLVLT